MEDFFTGNGYDIVDKKTFEPKEITFANIWVFVTRICITRLLK
jgi:hypothetical protein